MNDAVFAIPGLMPPTAPNWMSTIKTPEDGSLRMLLHVGKESDTVAYSIHLYGSYPGVIKDPNYEFAGQGDNVTRQRPKQALAKPMDTSTWPDFMTKTDVEPTDVIVPRRITCWQCPIPINEFPWLSEIDKLWYWVLELPARALPIGESVIEVCVNGRVFKYTVHRPAFDIHRKDNRTPAYVNYKPVYTSDAQEVKVDTAAGSIVVALTGLKTRNTGVSLSEFEYLLTVTHENTPETVKGILQDDTVTFAITPIPTPGISQYSIVYYRKGRGDEAHLPLVSGVI